MVRINFEAVYKKAGGILPEDKPTFKQKVVKVVAKIVSHPLFKVFRFLLLIKKCYNCVMVSSKLLRCVFLFIAEEGMRRISFTHAFCCM